MSRAPAVAAAALALATGGPLDDCLRSIATQRSTNVSPAFWHELTLAAANARQAGRASHPEVGSGGSTVPGVSNS